jgi:hypothetical protein
MVNQIREPTNRGLKFIIRYLYQQRLFINACELRLTIRDPPRLLPRLSDETHILQCGDLDAAFVSFYHLHMRYRQDDGLTGSLYTEESSSIYPVFGSHTIWELR